jgi:hypothetical protein
VGRLLLAVCLPHEPSPRPGLPPAGFLSWDHYPDPSPLTLQRHQDPQYPPSPGYTPGEMLSRESVQISAVGTETTVSNARSGETHERKRCEARHPVGTCRDPADVASIQRVVLKREQRIWWTQPIWTGTCCLLI